MSFGYIARSRIAQFEVLECGLVLIASLQHIPAAIPRIGQTRFIRTRTSRCVTQVGGWARFIEIKQAPVGSAFN